MKNLLYCFLLLFITAFLSNCDLIKQAAEKVPSMLIVEVVDENNEPYGYVMVILQDSSGRPLFSNQANDRGIAPFKEGLKAGTYTFAVKNVAGKELEVLEPKSVRVRIGKTQRVTVKVKRILGEEEEMSF